MKTELTHQLLLSEAQARTTAEALEFYMRFCIGQFDVPMVVQCRPVPAGYSVPDTRFEERDELLLRLRSLYFPELHGLGHSYGVGNKNGQPEQKQAMVAYDLYKHILYEFNKDAGFANVHSYPPAIHYSDQPVPQFGPLAPTVECTPPTSEDQAPAPVTRAGQTLGTITCIQGGDGLRWFGRKHESPVTGNGYRSPEAAIQDVVDWADGKEVPYVKHCQGVCVGCEKGGVKA